MTDGTANGRWSVSVEAEGDREFTMDEIVGLADAVAPHQGIASGIGTPRYGAQIVVQAGSRDEAEQTGTATFRAAAQRAGLPEYPIVRIEAVSEAEDAEWSEQEAPFVEETPR
jgi:hypothetical protein